MTQANQSHPASRITLETLGLLRERLLEEKSLEIVLISGSMSPLIKTGDRATIEPVRIEELRMLDIVVFWSVDKLICHCVWGHSVTLGANGERRINTRGLATSGFDYPVRESEILGRVTSHRLTAFTFAWRSFLQNLKRKLRVS
jgi:hypothetical protein